VRGEVGDQPRHHRGTGAAASGHPIPHRLEQGSDDDVRPSTEVGTQHVGGEAAQLVVLVHGDGRRDGVGEQLPAADEVAGTHRGGRGEPQEHGALGNVVGERERLLRVAERLRR
jgi:hypothetical protein